jgi:hypothetical protein
MSIEETITNLEAATMDPDEGPVPDLSDILDDLEAAIDYLKELEEWRACAKYSPTMEGPQFMGWDRSQMERCRKRYIDDVRT